MKIELVPIDQKSVDKLLSMMQAYYQFDELEFKPDIARHAALQLITDDKLGRIWFIAADQNLVGYLALTFGYSLEFGGKDAFIDEFFILGDYRHQGIGRTALLLAEQILISQEIQAVHLEVEHKNTGAENFYLSLGFESRTRFHLMSKKLK